jgi:hypothetical protein
LPGDQILIKRLVLVPQDNNSNLGHEISGVWC